MWLFLARIILSSLLIFWTFNMDPLEFSLEFFSYLKDISDSMQALLEKKKKKDTMVSEGA